jgi:hypothetical protein
MQTDRIRSEWLSEVPQRRYASPDEIAGAALFLMDDKKAGFVTGRILNVDGGFAAAGYLPVRARSHRDRPELRWDCRICRQVFVILTDINIP